MFIGDGRPSTVTVLISTTTCLLNRN